MLAAWRDANEELCRLTTLLTAFATSGDQAAFDRQSLVVEEARLAAENARTLVQMHRSTHDAVPSALRR